MKEAFILWLDDDWMATEVETPNELTKARAALEAELLQGGISPNIICRNSNAKIWEDLGEMDYIDILILDYGLSKDSLKLNAFAFLEKLERLRQVPPVIIYTSYTPSELEKPKPNKNIRGIFYKHESFEKFAQCTRALLDFAPLSFVVMSDLHIGYLKETKGISDMRFSQSLFDCLDNIRSEKKIDALFLCGDFAWRDPKKEVIESFQMIRNIAQFLRLELSDQVFICPGNHDINFESGGSSWDAFGELINLLGISNRFVKRQPDAPERQPFHDQTSLFSILCNNKLGIVVAGLNSNNPIGNGLKVEGLINEGQWHTLTEELKKYPAEYLKIVFLHHPIFSAPGGIYQDDVGLIDQGKALQTLIGSGVQLLLHGHAHFSAVHAHRLAVINDVQSNDVTGGAQVSELLTVACPSLIAEPNSAAPHRQFLIIHLDRADPFTGARKFSLESRIFDPAKCKWNKGAQLPEGAFIVRNKVST